MVLNIVGSGRRFCVGMSWLQIGSAKQVHLLDCSPRFIIRQADGIVYRMLQQSLTGLRVIR